MEKIKTLYKTSTGKIPFDEWLEKLDFQDSHQILVRISRLVLGNTSNCETVGGGVHEIKMYLGPGY
jgi:putative addiction module killer protein